MQPKNGKYLIGSYHTYDRYTSVLLITQFAMVFVESWIPFVLKAFDCRSRGRVFVYLPLMMEATSAGVENSQGQTPMLAI